MKISLFLFIFVMSFSAFAECNQIKIEGQDFVDNCQRKRFFHGFNVSGSVKLKETGFLPFKNRIDAKKSFSLMREKTGSNWVRFTIAWEGVQPHNPQIDANYLRRMTEQIKEAIHNKLYILLDYHSDLFSRYIFRKRSLHTGNGAPRWVVEALNLPRSFCFFCVHWGQNHITNPSVRKAYRQFWADVPLIPWQKTIQEYFLDQIEVVMAHLKLHLSEEEFHYILGLDPFNEPADGGMRGLKAKEWEQQMLFRFYKRVRNSMDVAGWEEKGLFAEPLVFWNSHLAPFVPATHAGHWPKGEIKNLVFNGHFYDVKRMTFPLKVSKSGEYAKDFSLYRKESKRLNIPTVCSEFGFPIDKGGKRDIDIILGPMLQGMETDIREKKIVSGGQYISRLWWHWDINHDQHFEFQNDNPKKLRRRGDAWNGENFSVITNRGQEYTVSPYLLERPYPRAIAGKLLFNLVQDNVVPRGMKPRSYYRYLLNDRDLFKNTRFYFFAFEPEGEGGVSEFFLPQSFFEEMVILSNTTVVFDKNSDIIRVKHTNEKRIYFFAVSDWPRDIGVNASELKEHLEKEFLQNGNLPFELVH